MMKCSPGRVLARAIGLLFAGGLAQAQLLEFEDPASLPLGSGIHDLVVADFDDDGTDDIAAAHAAGSGLPKGFTVMFSTGDGAYIHVSYPLNGDVESIHTADMDGNGMPDLVVVGQAGIHLELNDGSGGFVSAGILAVNGAVSELAIADFTGNNLPDFAITNTQVGTISVYRNTGGATYSAFGVYPGGVLPHYIEAGDVTGDGDPDLVVSRILPPAIFVLPNNGNGTFGSEIILDDTGRVVADLLIRDYDFDGEMDVMFLQANAEGRLNILLNNGDGTFGPDTEADGTSLIVGPDPRQLLAGDLDRDVDEDFVILHKAPKGFGTLMRVDSEWVLDETVGEPGELGVLADVDGDGARDMVFANGGSLRVIAQKSSTHDYVAGIVDDFAPGPGGAETAYPRFAFWDFLDRILDNPPEHFDDPGFNRAVAHSFENLPDAILGAELEIRVRATNIGSDNDRVFLGYAGATTKYWSAFIEDLPGVGGSFELGETATLNFDLKDLPPDQGVTNVLGLVNQDGRLDVRVQDDTEVDYMALKIRVSRPTQLRLEHGPIVNGQSTTFDITGALPGETIRLYYSLDGLGDDRGPGDQWGFLINPVLITSFVMTGSNASVTIPIGGLPPLEISFQAYVLRPGDMSLRSNTTTQFVY